MSDDQSFPLYSKSYPKLWAGSYSYVERFTDGKIHWSFFFSNFWLLLDDVAAIVEYARKRGVRVEVEFDVPG